MFKDLPLEQLAAYIRERGGLTGEEEQLLLSDRRTGARRLLEKYRLRAASDRSEKKRLHNMCSFERNLWGRGFSTVAGVDEAGRGPLAGPVVAAAVVLPRQTYLPGLNDSKQLSPRQREALFEAITRVAIGIGVGVGSVKLIDRVNIYNAAMKAMSGAIHNLPLTPAAVLVDGYPVKDLEIYQQALIGGDARSLSIAAASVVAKVTRDRLMNLLHRRYPQYGFVRHKGYATAEHREALRKYGPCPFHRRSFRLGAEPVPER